MKPPDWDRLQEIYHSALAQPRPARDAFLAKVCAGDAALLSKVKSLLAADDSLSGFLDTPVTTLEPLPANLIGQVVGGRYKVEKQLGAGGMSQVYLAWDQNLNDEPVVIKVLSRQLVHHEYVRQKFEHEVEALLRLKHPAVVRVSDRGNLDDGSPYIVMDFVDGETLRSQMPIDGMNLERAASILTQIGDALDHVHEAGVVHRDLKPQNIMLKRDTDSIVLIDFGIAKVKDPVMAPETTEARPIGTLLYMSPEQLRGDEITSVSDIYSMAVLAFEILDGRRPFNATSEVELINLQQRGVYLDELVRRRNLSPRARNALSKGLSFNPKRRFKRASEFSAQLVAGLRGEKRPIGIYSDVNSHLRRRVLLGALIVLLGVAAVYVYRKYLPPPQSPSNSFSYFLTVQPMRDGKEYGGQIKSHGENEIFDNGDKFQLTVISPQSAYVYIVNEGPPVTNDTNVTMIYPRQPTNNGSARVGANQPVQSDWLTFRGPAGDDNFWVVWSLSPVTQLENAKREAFNHPRGGLTDATMNTVKEFLKMKQSEVDVTVYHYQESQTAKARGKGDPLVTLAQFKHR